MSSVQPYIHDCGQNYLRGVSDRSFLRRLNAVCVRCQGVMPVHDDDGRLYVYLPVTETPKPTAR